MKKIIITRTSVSQGDDVFDHTLEIEIDEEWKIDQILKRIMEMNYLPGIIGGKATWSVAYDRPLAVIAQQWDSPEMLSKDFPYQGTRRYVNFDRLHFNYHMQLDPSIVYDVLSRFRIVSKDKY